MFLEKSACRQRAPTVNTPPPAAQKCSNGKQQEIDEAGRAEEVRAHHVDFVSSLFEIDGY